MLHLHIEKTSQKSFSNSNEKIQTVSKNRNTFNPYVALEMGLHAGFMRNESDSKF